MNNKKRALMPTKPCTYGEKCYRRNPDHFLQFSHLHLMDIINSKLDGNATADNPSSIYKIPVDLEFYKDILIDQCKIVEDLFPDILSTTDIKIKKISHDVIEPPPVTTASHRDIITVKPNNNTNVIDKLVKTTAIEQNASTSSNSKDTSIKVPAVLHSSTSSTSSSSSSAHSSNTGQPINNAHDKMKNIHDYISVVVPKGQMAKKLQNAAPYNFFLTAVTDSPKTHNEPLSVTFQEILDESLGEIESSVQINFMVDIGWLLGQYYFGKCLDKPLLLLYGEGQPELDTISIKKPQVTAIKIQMPMPFSVHHTKMMLFSYKDNSMRVIISTANLYEDDWHNRTQGIWISPKLERLPDATDTGAGDSVTAFRSDLIRYLTAYNIPKLQEWIAKIRKTNFKDINVFLVTSIPGSHPGSLHGHSRVGHLLSQYAAPISDLFPLVAQSSSIGSLGVNVNAWVMGQFGYSFRKDCNPVGLRRIPPFKMIYPSFENVYNSHDCVMGGACLPYSNKTHVKQPWLNGHLHQWSADKRFRNRAVPHIKTYCRWSDNHHLYWFLLTSANLSKAAWGLFNNAPIKQLRINNYEAGVLFLPKFVLNKEYFPMLEKDRTDDAPVFPMPYDVPLIRYSDQDAPFFMDLLTE